MDERIYGCDVSRHNGVNAVEVCLAKMNNIQFIIAKATEGVTYRDPMFYKHISSAEQKNKMIGAYHYARPDNGNNPVSEANNFVTAVAPYIGRCLFALDWEDKSLTESDSRWALEWCKAVYAMTGVKPVVYVQESYIKEMDAFAGEDFGLWVAKWSETEPKTSPVWNFWALWQKTNSPFDVDVFNGSAEQYMKYCTISTVEKDECDCECHYCGCCNKDIKEIKDGLAGIKGND